MHLGFREVDCAVESGCEIREEGRNEKSGVLPLFSINAADVLPKEVCPRNRP
jgi:hypothetical protein